MKLEKKLLEEVARFNQINKYARKLMNEQELPLPGAEETPPPVDDAMGGEVPPADAAPMGETPPADVAPLDTSNTEEMDITDLVNITKSIKKDVEDSKTDHSGVLNKMDDVFSKLDELESKLANMDNIITKIDELGSRIQQIKEPTPQEKLQMRSLDSYPFNQNPQQFFTQKQEEMRSSGKNEYVLTKDDIQNYSQETIKDTFNIQDDDEFKF